MGSRCRRPPRSAGQSARRTTHHARRPRAAGVAAAATARVLPVPGHREYRRTTTDLPAIPREPALRHGDDAIHCKHHMKCLRRGQPQPRVVCMQIGERGHAVQPCRNRDGTRCAPCRLRPRGYCFDVSSVHCRNTGRRISTRAVRSRRARRSHTRIRRILRDAGRSSWIDHADDHARTRSESIADQRGQVASGTDRSHP